MPTLTKGTKEVLINDISAAFPLIFTKLGVGAQANKEIAATAADGTKLYIKGFGEFYVSTLSGVSGSFSAVRGRNEKAGIVGIDSAQAGQITTSGSNLAGAAVTVIIQQRTMDPLAEFIGGDPGRYYKQRVYTVAVPANVTAAQFVQLLADTINATTNLFPEADEPLELQITASVTTGKISITCADSHVTLKVFIDDLDPQSKAIVPVLKPTVDVASDEGRNIYRTLKGTRLQGEGTNSPYTLPGPLELPVKGYKYTSFYFLTTTARPDLSGQAAADDTVATLNKFLVYVAETPGNAQAITDLTNYLDRAGVGVVVYNSQLVDNTTKTLFLAN